MPVLNLNNYQKKQKHDIRNNHYLHYAAAIHFLNLFGINNCKRKATVKVAFFIDFFLPYENLPQKNTDFRKKNLNFVAFSI